jgi:hypothetical protein
MTARSSLAVSGEEDQELRTSNDEPIVPAASSLGAELEAGADVSSHPIGEVRTPLAHDSFGAGWAVEVDAGFGPLMPQLPTDL